MESLSNPVEFVRKPQPDNARTRRIAVEMAKPDSQQLPDEPASRNARQGELERVVAASGSVMLPAIIKLAVETAMRRTEIVGLRWEHIDLNLRVAHLPSTKNGSSRDMPLSSSAI